MFVLNPKKLTTLKHVYMVKNSFYYCKIRINTMQIKSNRDEVYLTLMYNREEEIGQDSWNNEKQRELEKVRNLFLT